MTAKKTAEPTPVEESADVEILVSDPSKVTLLSGTEVNIERLRMRQLFALLRIATRGGGPLLQSMDFDPEDDASSFGIKFAGLLVAAVPEAPDETVEFIQSMVTHRLTIAKPRTKADRDSNNQLAEELAEELDNPEFEDIITIFESVIQLEAEHIQSLGKRLAAMFKMSMAQVKVNSSSQKS